MEDVSYVFMGMATVRIPLVCQGQDELNAYMQAFAIALHLHYLSAIPASLLVKTNYRSN